MDGLKSVALGICAKCLLENPVCMYRSIVSEVRADSFKNSPKRLVNRKGNNCRNYMPVPLKSYDEIAPGDYYEDCAFHPCLCVAVNREDDEILGISLVDGSYPRACSIRHCGPQLLTLKEAIDWKLNGPVIGEVPKNKQWWKEIDQPAADEKGG